MATTKPIDPAKIGNNLADTIIRLIERKTTGDAVIDKAAIKTIMVIVSGRLMNYFLMKRLG